MKKPSDADSQRERLRNSIIGLGERSIRKSYYPELIKRIAELEKANEALRQSEEKYRTIFENSGTALMFIEDDMTISICNKEFERLSGYARSEVEGRIKWTEIATIQGDDLERMKDYHRLRRIDSDAAPTTYQFQLIGREGTLKDVIITVTTMPGTKQSLAAFLDITELNRVIKALRESDRKFKAIFDKSFQFIGLLKTDGTVIEANETALRFCEIPESSVIGKPFWETPWWSHSKKLQEKLRTAIQTAAEGEFVRFEATHLDLNGNIHYVDFSLKPVIDVTGNVVLLIPEGRDISDLKRTEEERTLLATAIEQASEGIIVTDTKWITQYVNPAFECMSGYDKNELIGRPIGILKSDRYDKTFFSLIRSTLIQGNPWSGRLSNRRKDGTDYIVEVTASAIRDQSGAIINYLGIHRDITHELKLEKELQQAHKMEAIGTLAGGIAHDFNNILTSIIGFTDLARARLPEENPVHNYLSQVLKSASRAADLVRQILTFSRQTEQTRQPIQVVPIVKETLKLLRASLPSTIDIHKDIAANAEESVILADPTQIHQVLMNLGTNAAHAMRSKGGVLSVNVTSVVADASMVSRYADIQLGPYVRVTVSDTGQGMAAGIIERIFDPYYTTKDPGEGTGMGLAVVQGIVKSHSGAITVSSKPGTGTSFNVFFPMVKMDVPLMELEDNVVRATGTKRILFVDDEKNLVDLGREMLESLDYSVTATTNSSEALETFRAQPDAFDLVITDMTMPGLTGKDLAKELISIRPDISIILTTGFSELINEKQARKAGIGQFLMKPYTNSDLAKIIRKALEEK
jgi:PAS domain S-box-containing protein